MNVVVDSSAWIEYFSGGQRAGQVQGYLDKKSDLVIPTIVIFEVDRWIKKHLSEEAALKYASQMNSPKMIPLSDSIAMHAADLSLEHELPLADSVVYATAFSLGAKLVTFDSDFKNLKDVILLEK
jgi:predicted nucleic acid-binding protein